MAARGVVCVCIFILRRTYIFFFFYIRLLCLSPGCRWSWNGGRCAVVCLRRRLIFLISGYTSHALLYFFYSFSFSYSTCYNNTMRWIYLCALLTLAIWGRLGYPWLGMAGWLWMIVSLALCRSSSGGGGSHILSDKSLIMGEEDHSVHDPSLSSFISIWASATIWLNIISLLYYEPGIYYIQIRRFSFISSCF